TSTSAEYPPWRDPGLGGASLGWPTVTVTSGLSCACSPSRALGWRPGRVLGKGCGAEIGSWLEAGASAEPAATQMRPSWLPVIEVTSSLEESYAVVTAPEGSIRRTSPDPDVPAQIRPRESA